MNSCLFVYYICLCINKTELLAFKISKLTLLLKFVWQTLKSKGMGVSPVEIANQIVSQLDSTDPYIEKVHTLYNITHVHVVHVHVYIIMCVFTCFVFVSVCKCLHRVFVYKC